MPMAGDNGRKLRGKKRRGSYTLAGSWWEWRLYTRLIVCLVLSALTVSTDADDKGKTVRQWLEKMALAAKGLNYDGTFVYRHGEQLETMRIIHRGKGEGEKERLVSLNGVAREVLRDKSKVTCIQPDRRAVVVEKSQGRGILPSIFGRSDHSYGEYYALALDGEERILGRSTQAISIRPGDEFRYGYRLWLDQTTGLLLKLELRGRDETPLEQILFTSLELPDRIPDALLAPTISGEGFTWHRRDKKRGESKPHNGTSAWQIGWLPAGYYITGHDINHMHKDRAQVEHMVYSDGLASLSIYIELSGPVGEHFTGFSRMGAINAFGAVTGRYQITVV
ncbi:MAG: hypothetical protein GY731_19430, partial [Gammaproteobacteria bacterium]|nr:hypothetical protein [Gammaproteobacteria bacterium]